MKQIRLHDTYFSLYISEDQIQERLEQIAQELNQTYLDKQLILVVVLKGAFMVASDLIKKLSIQPEIDFIRVSSYEGEMQSSGKVRNLLGLETDIQDRHVLLIEDIVDTGYTTSYLMEELGKKNPASLQMFSLLYKPANLKKGSPPDYIGFEIPPDFVVGYGMDYAQLGRELKDIYTRVTPPES